MRKMTEGDIKAIVSLLENWRRSPLHWKLLQHQVSKNLLGGEASWSRQSLQASNAINTAWLSARVRLASARKLPIGTEEDSTKYERLMTQYMALEVKYNNLAMRHRQLIYNATMLPGGARLLLDPLPDNTPAQKIGIGARRSRHK